VAITADKLSVRRAAVLLRCQKVREQRRQRDALRAELDSDTAAAAEQSAWAAVSSGKVTDADRLRQACGDLGGRTVRPEELATLPMLEQALAHGAEVRDQTLAMAAEVARVAREVADAAREALLLERRATERRSKLTERSQTLLHLAVDAAEELERDEQIVDTWRSVPRRSASRRSA
jgi:hypothetical protein